MKATVEAIFEDGVFKPVQRPEIAEGARVQVTAETGLAGSGGTTTFDTFMIEEYKTIAAAHFDLHAGLRQTFRFYLGLVAVPFTVMAVALKDHSPSLNALPDVMRFLFIVTPITGLLLYIHMINTRFDIILYTRTVNGARAYFERSAPAFVAAGRDKYLKLPADTLRPAYREGLRRPYWWLFCLVAVVNSIYVFIGAANYLTAFGTWSTAIAALALYGWAYYGLSAARESEEIPAGKQS